LVVDDPATQPEAAAELADSLTLAFLVLLDELTPVERAVLLLHDVFGYPFDEIAGMVDLSPAACRQIASRTRRKLHHEPHEVRRPQAAREQELIGALLATVAQGDVEQVMALLAPDVVLLSDGGPDRHAARRPVVGPDRVARLMVNIARRIPPAADVRLATVNGEPGIVFRAGERADLVLSFSFGADGRVRRVYSQLNPEKLRHLS
jgi:RNA polymerase sigma-70 factor (ECF subfamily)